MARQNPGQQSEDSCSRLNSIIALFDLSSIKRVRNFGSSMKPVRNFGSLNAPVTPIGGVLQMWFNLKSVGMTV